MISFHTTSEMLHAVASLTVFTQDRLTDKSNGYAKKVRWYEVTYHHLGKTEVK